MQLKDRVTDLEHQLANPLQSTSSASSAAPPPAPGATNYGTAIIDFGAFPGSNEASVAVTGQATIASSSKAYVFMMANDTTSDHTANDHRYAMALIDFLCTTPSAGVGFTIYGISVHKLQGTFALRWAWGD